MSGETVGPGQAELFGLQPRTPIAAELHRHFAEGGSISEGIKLAEVLERAQSRSLIASKSRTSEGQRGSRLPADWRPSQAEISFALDRGMPARRLDIEVEKFRNYWTAKSGASATKRDWSATWRNWIITAMERGYGPANYGGGGPGTFDTPRRSATGSDAILAGLGRLAHRIDERRMSTVSRGWEVSDDADAAGEFDLKPYRTG
jgi:hypothetical protein